ncbi:3-carboxy-cis,cis-muconate cycloisomerase [Leifsonia bigeumensis]|uniref:3-carboxy-cis,cis-muconate cycloisomerase n=1 Tax=Leifsonella bigeumensis TaxID=433643 RepID=A0ABP7FVF0_9MICO
MTSDEQASDDLPASADVGLLSPAWAGTPVADETGDPAVLRAMLDAEVALAEAGAAVGAVPDAAAQVIREVAATARFDLVALAAGSRAGGNPVIPLVAELRRAVTAADPRAARFVHLGATSQDILDSALMLVARRAIRLVTGDLDATVAALAALAEKHRGTPMAGRSLTQHSVPITFGLKAAGWLMGVSDARGFLAAVAEALPAQLGGASGTLASFEELAPGHAVELAEVYAARLGLSSPPLPWHTVRTPVVRLADALAGSAGALGRIGVDVALLSRTEISELHEPTGGGSSSMPQKQNPARSVLIHAATRTAPGLAAELHRSAIAVDERPDGAWHAEWQNLRELLRCVGGAASLAAELTGGLRIDPERMRANLAMTGPLIVSERVSLAVGPVLGADTVRKLIAESAGDPDGLGGRLQAALPDWNAERIRELLDPLAYLGASDALIDRALAHVRATGSTGL